MFAFFKINLMLYLIDQRRTGNEIPKWFSALPTYLLTYCYQYPSLHFRLSWDQSSGGCYCLGLKFIFGNSHPSFSLSLSISLSFSHSFLDLSMLLSNSCAHCKEFFFKKKCANPGLFLSIFVLFKHKFYRKKPVDVSDIRARIVVKTLQPKKDRCSPGPNFLKIFFQRYFAPCWF